MGIANNLDGGIADLRKLTQDVDETLTGNRGKIDEIIANMNETSKNFKEFSDDIKHNPWKLLMKTKEKKPREEPKQEKSGEPSGNKGSFNR
ncbi:MAG: hypothetical protein NTV07_07210 [Candidatus Omnitrophica bacterium]|nr:hypothetical protein [Candidatus Omnitrophota bacterium]